MKKFRHEIKYFIDQMEYQALRSRLKAIMRLDKHAGENGDYHIRSLYFDSFHEAALSEKLAGIADRKKYRIRIYNKSDQVISLERKIKSGDCVSKESIPLTREQYSQIIRHDYRFLSQQSAPLAKDFYLDLTTKKMRPKIIVDYEREAYIFPAGDVRITFDKNLSSVVNEIELFHPELVTFHNLKPQIVILEIKFTGFLPSFIRQCLQLGAAERTAISKYVICRMAGQTVYKI